MAGTVIRSMVLEMIVEIPTSVNIANLKLKEEKAVFSQMLPIVQKTNSAKLNCIHSIDYRIPTSPFYRLYLSSYRRFTVLFLQDTLLQYKSSSLCLKIVSLI